MIRSVFWKYFFDCVACLLFFLILSFVEQKFLTFVKIQLIYFFKCCAFSVASKKSLPYPSLSRYSPILPSRSFILALYFKNVPFPCYHHPHPLFLIPRVGKNLSVWEGREEEKGKGRESRLRCINYKRERYGTSGPLRRYFT